MTACNGYDYTVSMRGVTKLSYKSSVSKLGRYYLGAAHFVRSHEKQRLIGSHLIATAHSVGDKQR